MTGLVIAACFLAVAAVITVIAAVLRPGGRRRALTSLIVAAVLCVLTAIFDSWMIAAGLFTYPAGSISEVRIGLAPIEDLGYGISLAFLLPSLDVLFGRRRQRRRSV